MNVLSVVCLLLLIPYLLIALSFMPKDKGQQLFRMIYSAVTLGLLGTVLYINVEQMISYYSDYINPAQNMLRPAMAVLLLLIPANIVIVSLNLVLKKSRPFLLMIISAAVSVATAAGTVLYCYFADSDVSNSFVLLLQVCILFIPCILFFAVSGLLDTSTRREKAIHRAAMYLLLIAAVGFAALTFISNYGFYAYAGIGEILRALPLLVILLAVPLIPIGVFEHFRHKEAIRNGVEEKKFFDLSRLRKNKSKTEENKKA